MADLNDTMDRLAVMMWNHDGDQLQTLRDCMELLTVQQSKIKELESELEYVTSHGPQIFGGY